MLCFLQIETYVSGEKARLIASGGIQKVVCREKQKPDGFLRSSTNNKGGVRLGVLRVGGAGRE